MAETGGPWTSVQFQEKTRRTSFLVHTIGDGHLTYYHQSTCLAPTHELCPIHPMHPSDLECLRISNFMFTRLHRLCVSILYQCISNINFAWLGLRYELCISVLLVKQQLQLQVTQIETSTISPREPISNKVIATQKFNSNSWMFSKIQYFKNVCYTQFKQIQVPLSNKSMSSWVSMF